MTERCNSHPIGPVVCAALTAMVVLAAAQPAFPCQADNPSQSFLESSRASVAPAPIHSDVPRSSQGAMGDLTWFDNKEDFEAAAGDMICRQDFEESTLPPVSIDIIADELTSGVPCEPEGDCPFPNGLEGCEAMTYQSNTLGGESDNPSPSGGFVLDVLSAGFAGARSDLVIMDRFQMSVDVLMDYDVVQGFGATPVTFQGGGSVEIRVYDIDNNFLGMNEVPASPAGRAFFGVIYSGAAIGRVNGFDPVGGNNGAEGLDNIQIHLAGGCTRDPQWQCDGDVDGDAQVNPVDSGLVQAAFGSVDEQDLCNYDVDCDGQINPVDSGIVQSLFGTCEQPRSVCP